ncbi:hypothetical protein KSE1242_06140 [Staphylococcus epidermidis]
MTDAITAPVKVNTTGKCKILVKNSPTGLLVENIINNIKPRTVGGNTIGKMIKLSNRFTQYLFLLYSHLEINMPKIVTIIVLIKATRKEIQKDVKSGIAQNPLYRKLIFFKNLFSFIGF